MGPLLKNAATEEMFEFPENSYGTVYTTLVALAAGSLRENNLRDRDVLRVGLWQTAETRNGEVLTYLKSENLPYEIVYYDTAAEQQQALVGGAVDVISSVSLSPVPTPASWPSSPPGHPGGPGLCPAPHQERRRPRSADHRHGEGAGGADPHGGIRHGAPV